MAETIKGINIKLSLDGKDLDNDLKGINKELKEQQKDLRAINSNLKYDSSNIELWRKKQTQLNEILTQTKKRLDTQNKALEKAREGVKLGTVSQDEFRKLQRNVTYTEADLKRLNNELGKTKDKIKDLGNVKFDKIAKLGGTLTKTLTVPILGAVTALGALAKGGADAADELDDTAKKLGLSIEALQEWNHVAKISGSETQSLEKAFIKVNAMLGDIALGDVNSIAGPLHALGVSMDDLKGKDTSQAFEILRKALSKVEDESLKVALANKLFGDKIGSEILPMLKLETSQINGLRKEAHALGIITSKQAETTGAFNDSLDRLKQSTTALKVELAVALVPAMQKVVEKIQSSVIPAVSSLIKWWSNLSDGTKKLITFFVALTAAIGPVLTIIGKVGPLIKTLTLGIKGVGTALSAAGIGLNAATLGIGALVAIVVMALMKSEKFKELLSRLMETFMKLLDPIIKVVDILVDALMPIIDVIINIVVKLIDILVPIIDIILKPMIKQLEFLGKIFEIIAPLIEMVGKILQAVLVPAFKALEKVLTPIFKILEKIIQFFEKIFEFVGQIGDVVGDALGGIGDMVGGAVDGIGNFVGGVADKVGSAFSGVGNFVGGIFNNVSDFAGNVVNGIGDFVGKTTDKIKESASNAVKGVSGVIGNVIDGVSNFANDATKKVGGFFGKVGGWFSDTFNLKKQTNASKTSTTNNQLTTHNSVTINTSSSNFDIDSINKVLGGKYI